MGGGGGEGGGGRGENRGREERLDDLTPPHHFPLYFQTFFILSKYMFVCFFICLY